MDRNVHVFRMSSAQLVAAIENKLMKGLGRAKRNFLLCKAAIERRKLELAEVRRQGQDTSKLERMIERLEASREAHRETIDRLESN